MKVLVPLEEKVLELNSSTYPLLDVVPPTKNKPPPIKEEVPLMIFA